MLHIIQKVTLVFRLITYEVHVFLDYMQKNGQNKKIIIFRLLQKDIIGPL